MKPHTSPALGMTSLVTPRQDLLLNRAMLNVNKTPYVGRFARDWHRLSTTEPLTALGGILDVPGLRPGVSHEGEKQTQAQYQRGQRHQGTANALSRL